MNKGEKMDDINYVELTLEIQTVEPYLERYKEVFLFEGSHFDGCETIEEIRDQLEQERNEEKLVNYIHLKTFKDLDDVDKDNFFEYIGQ